MNPHNHTIARIFFLKAFSVIQELKILLLTLLLVIYLLAVMGNAVTIAIVWLHH